MNLSFIRARVPPRPISHYALALFLVLVVALGIFAAFVLHDTARLREAVARSDEKLARQELEEAILLLERQAEGIARALESWDEARQQLENPAYYAYWRSTRALGAGVVPASEAIDGIELYDRHGVSLATAAAGEDAMPSRISPDELQPFLRHEDGHDHLYFFYPFHADATKGLLRLGYVGIKLDFQQGLGQLRKFRYVDMLSVHVEGHDGEALALEEVVPALTFQTLANPETRALERLIVRAFYEIGFIIAAISLLGYLALVSIVTKPLNRLSGHIDAMRQGKGETLGDAYRGLLAVTELENVRHSLNDYQRQLDEMHLSLAGKNQELWALAHRDPLTGVHNRRAFEDDWHALLRAQGEHPPGVAFLLFDCDHFKAINDSYGHQVGDQVIQGLAQSLLAALRGGDRLYRLGGDEFATVVLASGPDDARQLAERCIAHILEHDFASLGVKEPVRISVGIAFLAAADEDALQRLHRQADIAMYEAKRPGQGKIAVYAPEMGVGQEALVSNAETSAVFAAVGNPETLEMHYQPLLALPSGKIEYYEALVRIRDGERLIMPASILPVIELRGLEVELDLAVLERVRRDLVEGRIPAGSGVALNVSGPGIVSPRVNDALMQFIPLLDAYKLVVEVTETALITQIAQASANLNRLRRHGFTIALDDFGSGYSSLRYLSSMPVDVVKFDISMVHSLLESGRQALLVEDLARLIKDAGYRLVAEGVESEALLQRVAELGFAYAQGVYVGQAAYRAAPVASVPERV